MKVLNLVCAQHHRFEGWFSSEDDYQNQDERGLLSCPMCGDGTVRRLPSAPRINMMSSRQRTEPSTAEVIEAGPTPQQQVRAEQLLKVLRQVVENTEDVGERFPEEARRIHYGEAEGRGIRGRATREEAAALADEGISVLALDLPPALKGPRH
ncbi:MAG: DUF1178 family protein [Proteobacteria bacterium]|nr:DUF1178 family protein [Pseudomonadota bacterium]